MTAQTAELYDGTELEEGDTVVLTLVEGGETQPMDVGTVNDRYGADLKLNGDFAGEISINPAWMSKGKDMDRVAQLQIGISDDVRDVDAVEVRD